MHQPQPLPFFPDIETRYTDIKARDNSTAPRVDIYAAGIPCITWASCGKGQGLQDPRGQLWAHSLAYVVENTPKVALLECAPTLITWAKFRPVLDNVIHVLEQAGYHVEARLVSTEDHGLPQHRDRTYVLAFLKTSLRQKFQWPEPLGDVLPLWTLIKGTPVKDPKDMLPTGPPSQRNLVKKELGKITASGKLPLPGRAPSWN